MMPVGSSSFLLPGLVLFLSATEPDWVLTGSSTQFSHERYLTGRGSADTPGAADDRARADIGRTFSVGVNSAATVTAQARIVSGPGGTQVFGTEGASELIQTTSKVILEGVEIVARFVDPRTKLHHSLAALERSKGLAIIVPRSRPLIASCSSSVAPHRQPIPASTGCVPREESFARSAPAAIWRPSTVFSMLTERACRALSTCPP